LYKFVHENDEPKSELSDCDIDGSFFGDLQESTQDFEIVNLKPEEVLVKVEPMDFEEIYVKELKLTVNQEAPKPTIESPKRPRNDRNCDLCGKNFRTIKQLRSHKQRAHKTVKGKPQNQAKPRNDSKKYTCDHCGKLESTLALLRLHFNAKHAPKVDCPICGDPKPPGVLSGHITRVHCDYSKCKSENCDQYFRTSDEHRNHAEEKHPDENLSIEDTIENQVVPRGYKLCPFCGKAFQGYFHRHVSLLTFFPLV
jgi:rubrerythrin